MRLQQSNSIVKPLVSAVSGRFRKNIALLGEGNIGILIYGCPVACCCLGNQIRGLCGEYGLCFRQSIRHLRTDLVTALEDTANELSQLMREKLRLLYDELLELDARVSHLERKLHALLREREEYTRL